MSDEKVKDLVIKGTRPSLASAKLELPLCILIQLAWAESPSDRIDALTFFQEFALAVIAEDTSLTGNS